MNYKLENSISYEIKLHNNLLLYRDTINMYDNNYFVIQIYMSKDKRYYFTIIMNNTK